MYIGTLRYEEYANTSEKDDVPHFQPLLEKVVEMSGLPMAVISDMQPAIIESEKNVMPDILINTASITSSKMLAVS
jgi:hypothetical protein